MLVQVEVVGVRIEMPSNQPIVLLKEIEGSRFLPIWVGAVEATAIAFAQQGMAAQRPLTHDLIANLLESEGFLVQTAGSAVEAKRVAKLFDPDLALLDIELGDGPNGLDLAESLLALYPGLSVFF